MKIINLIRILLGIISVIAFNSVIAFSQGSWNLQYCHLDSLDNSFVDKEIRIDFKSSITDTLPQETIEALDIRWLLYKKDTVTIVIEDHTIEFIEKWRIYPDHGVLNEQLLETMEEKGKKRKKMQIRNMILKSINENSLTLKISIYKFNTCNSRIHLMDERFLRKREYELEERIIIIKKNHIKGILSKS